jgi:hypothetical protein
MALWKLGFIMDEYGWKSEFCNYVQWKCDILNFSIICRTVFGICKLGFITDQSGWKNLNFYTNFGGSLSYKISKISEKLWMIYMKKSIYSLV